MTKPINPIPKSSLFTTPADVEHLALLLNSTGSKEEQRIAWQAAMMAMNLAYELVKDEYEPRSSN